MKSLIVIFFIIVLKIFGNVSLSEGMNQVGEVDVLALVDPSVLFAFGLQTLSNVWIIIAMFFLLSYTLLYLSSLSWLDLSYLLPMTTLSYVFNALLAWLVLGETIPETRWIGTLMIMIGVLVVGIGGHRRSRRKELNSSSTDKN